MTRSTIRTYTTYSFKDKDPVIDEVRTLVKDSGLSYKQIEAECRVSRTTLRGWFHGKIRKPQSATIEAVGRACGFKRKWVKN